MKGLLLKDLYMIKKYCKAYLLIAIVFIALSCTNNDSFFVFYPCLLCGMIPAQILGYDERSKWMQYCETMPYTKGQIVSGKYLIGLGVQLAILIVVGIVQAVKMCIGRAFVLEEYLTIMMLLLIMSLLASSIALPFMFKYGVEKGRLAYYIMIGVICAGSIIASGVLSDGITISIPLNIILPIICGIGIGLYALSWYLSVVFYRKREQ